MMTALRMLGLLAAALGLAACATLRPPMPTTVAPADPEAVWGRVLAEHVDGHGAIDFVGLRERPRDLEAYVTWVAGHGPRSTPALFPTRESRLAYYINAYNALAMYQVVATPRRPEKRVRFFVTSRVLIDGRSMSLYAFENDVIRPLGEARVHFALNCMVRGCPRLPRGPFTAGRLDTMLDAETRRFLDDPRNVQVDPPLRTVRLNSILRFYTADFLAAAPSLPAYVNRYRSAPIPEDYRVRFIPYDWTLHQR
jgi:hypothetical protein